MADRDDTFFHTSGYGPGNTLGKRVFVNSPTVTEQQSEKPLAKGGINNRPKIWLLLRAFELGLQTQMLEHLPFLPGKKHLRAGLNFYVLCINRLMNLQEENDGASSMLQMTVRETLAELSKIGFPNIAKHLNAFFLNEVYKQPFSQAALPDFGSFEDSSSRWKNRKIVALIRETRTTPELFRIERKTHLLVALDARLADVLGQTIIDLEGVCCVLAMTLGRDELERYLKTATNIDDQVFEREQLAETIETQLPSEIKLGDLVTAARSLYIGLKVMSANRFDPQHSTVVQSEQMLYRICFDAMCRLFGLYHFDLALTQTWQKISLFSLEHFQEEPEQRASSCPIKSDESLWRLVAQLERNIFYPRKAT
jgi:hypothetical protein